MFPDHKATASLSAAASSQPPPLDQSTPYGLLYFVRPASSETVLHIRRSEGTFRRLVSIALIVIGGLLLARQLG